MSQKGPEVDDEQLLNSLIALQQALSAENITIRRLNKLNESIREVHDGTCSLRSALKYAANLSKGADLAVMSQIQLEQCMGMRESSK